jgi:RNA polymerase sigma-70 factor (ECF subfamily)
MRAYQDMVFSTAARLVGDDAQAEDIAQDVFVKAYEHFTELRSSATAGGWLKTVSTNLSLNHLNRYRKRWRLFSQMSAPGADEDGDEVEFASPLPEQILAEVEGEQRRALIDAALKALPEHQRVPLVLYHFEELSYEEIAAKLHASLAKVKTDIRRARIAMLALLQSRGIDHATLQD